MQKTDSNAVELTLSKEVMDLCGSLHSKIKNQIEFPVDIVLIISAILSTTKVPITGIRSVLEEKHLSDGAKIKLPRSILITWQKYYDSFIDQYARLLLKEIRTILDDEKTNWIIQLCEERNRLNVKYIIFEAESYCDKDKIKELKEKFNIEVDFEWFFNAVILSTDAEHIRIVEYIREYFSRGLNRGLNKWE